MFAERPSKRCDVNVVCEGRSHRVHFLTRKWCSSASPWLYRSLDDGVFQLAGRLGEATRPLILRENQTLDPAARTMCDQIGKAVENSPGPDMPPDVSEVWAVHSPGLNTGLIWI